MPLPWQTPFSRSIVDPRNLPGLSLWIDSKDVGSQRNDAGNVPANSEGIKLWSDKSGNSSVNVLCLNGVAGNYASVLDSVPLSITGDIDVRVLAMLPTWTPAATSMFLSKAQNAGQRSYDFYTDSTGKLYFRSSTDGTALGTVASSVATGFAAYSTNWIRATRASASGTTTFYTSSDGVNWSALGTPQASTAGNLFDGTDPLNIGAQTTSAFLLTGNIHRAQIYNGIAGTLVFDANFATASKLATSFTESSSNAATVTINTSGATGARISGARDLYQGTAANQPILTIAGAGNYLTFDGSNDYLKAAAFSLSQPATIYGVLSAVSWTSGDAFLDGDAALSAALVQISASPTFNLTVTASACLNSGLAVGTTGVVTAIPNAASSLTRVNRLAASTGDTGAAKVLNGFTLGSRGSGSSNANITAQEVLIYAAAHDKATQERVILYLSRKWNIAA